MSSQATHAYSAKTALALFSLTAAVVAYPPVYAVLAAGDRGYLSFVHGDALLYLTIARNSVGGFFTFDNTTPTNGFHPLWQYFLTMLIAHDTPPASMVPFHISLWTNVATAATGAGLCAVAIYKYTRSFLLGMLVVPSVYFLVIGSLYDSQPVWESLGGMESGFSMLFGGVLIYIIASHAGGRPETTLSDLFDGRGLRNVFLQMGLVLPFIVLSRLDDIFLLPMLSAVILWLVPTRTLRERILAIAKLTTPSTLIVLAYMVFNKSYAGTYFPISGKAKGGFVLAQSLYITLAQNIPPILNLKNMLTAKQSSPYEFYLNAHRPIEVLVPTAIAIVYMAWVWVKKRNEARFLLPFGIAGYIILKAAYNLSYVHLWHQGGWYFALTLMSVSFLVAITLQPLAERLAREPVLNIALPAFYGAYIVMCAGRYATCSAYISSQLELDYFHDVPTISQELRRLHPDPKLVAFDDGMTGYALPFSTIHGFAFAADLETFNALQAGHLLRHSYDRGHTILTSGCYMPVSTDLPTSESVREFLKESFLEEKVKSELDDFDYRLLYVEPKTHAPFIELIPRAS